MVVVNPSKEKTPTLEQQAVIDSAVIGENGIYVIDSAAGSGKTTTAVNMVKNYVATFPQNKVLVLVRGRDMRNELQDKFKSLNNVECATVHSYAYQRFARAKGLKRLNVLADKGDLFKVISDIKREDESLKFIPANLIVNLFDAYYSQHNFCDINLYALYLLKNPKKLREDAISQRADERLVEAFQYIYTRMLQNNQYTHDMYVKEYAMNYDDITSFDLVVIDEAQDLNIYMSKLLDRIECNKLYLIGDEHQQLFSWENCINIMATYRHKAVKVMNLTKSFRCNDKVLERSNHILNYLETKDYKAIPVEAGHEITELPYNHTKATLFYTNAAMIGSALLNLMKNNNIKIKFKGFDNTSVKSLLGKRLTYLLSFLELDGKTKLKESLEKKYKAWSNGIPYLIHEADMLARREGITLCEYIKIHGNELEAELRQSHKLYITMMLNPLGIEGCLDLLDKNLKRVPTPNVKIEEYSTVHKAKGFEWDYVVLGEDAWDFDTTNGFCVSYVGLTRAKIDCDSTVLTKAINYYDEVKEYLDWTPTLDGYKGDLMDDLIVAKCVRFVRNQIPTLFENADERCIILLHKMIALDKLPPSESNFDYSNEECVLALVDEFEEELLGEQNNSAIFTVPIPVRAIYEELEEPEDEYDFYSENLSLD